MTDDLIEALLAPSFKQDSRWHTPKAVYATKPRALLSEAAERIVELEKERKRLAVLADERAELMGELFRKQHAAEASLAAIKSRIDVEGMARIVDPVAFEEFYLEDGRVDQEVADIFEEAVEDTRAKAQALRTLILGEE